MNHHFLIPPLLCAPLLLPTVGAQSVAILGIRADKVDTATQQAYASHIPPGTGLIITDIAANTPAQQHLRLGDVLLQADGIPLRSAQDLAQLLRLKNEGSTLHLVLLRNGERQELHCPLTAKKTQTPPDKTGRREINKLLILLVPNGNAPVNIPAVRRHLLRLAELQLAEKDSYATCTIYLQSGATLIRIQSSERVLNIRCTPDCVPEQTLRADFYHRDLERLPKELEQLLLKATFYRP